VVPVHLKNEPLLGVRRPVAAFACSDLNNGDGIKSIEKWRWFSADQSGDKSPHSKEKRVQIEVSWENIVRLIL
jgi:hypothetical protein